MKGEGEETFAQLLQVLVEKEGLGAPSVDIWKK